MSRGGVHTAESLRREVSARNLERARAFAHEMTFGSVPSWLYSEDENGNHGNFLTASYRRICADPEWRMRLAKPYTASARVARSQDRRRFELDCGNSSDALLMNIFCYPRVLTRTQVCTLLGIAPGQKPRFGVRAGLAMRKNEVDRTELDMVLDDLLVEAKLTETGFQTASWERMERYDSLHEIFDADELPISGRGVAGYQLIRGVLAAHAHNSRFLLLCDGRRADLQQVWWSVLRAVRSCDLRSRMALLSWQELSAALPLVVQQFLAEKYGIEAHP